MHEDTLKKRKEINCYDGFTIYDNIIFVFSRENYDTMIA